MLREKDELTVSVSGEARERDREVGECELCCRDSIASVVERVWCA